MILCLGTFLISMVSLAFFCFWNFHHIRNDEDPSTDNENYYLIAGCLVLGITLIFIILFCCLWDRILLASRIVQATADYITDIKRIIFIPLIFLFMIILYMIYWSISGAYIWSIGESYHKKGYPYGNVRWNQNTKYLLFVKLFSLLWVVAFLHYACQFVLISVACIWYFSNDRHNLGSPICVGLYWGLVVHFGTLALGSFLLALIWLV